MLTRTPCRKLGHLALSKSLRIQYIDKTNITHQRFWWNFHHHVGHRRSCSVRKDCRWLISCHIEPEVIETKLKGTLDKVVSELPRDNLGINRKVMLSSASWIWSHDRRYSSLWISEKVYENAHAIHQPLEKNNKDMVKVSWRREPETGLHRWPFGLCHQSGYVVTLEEFKLSDELSQQRPIWWTTLPWCVQIQWSSHTRDLQSTRIQVLST
jgi:hypothetical protein